MKHILDSLVQENHMRYDDEGIFVMTSSEHRARRMQVQLARWSSSKPGQQSLGDEETEESKQKEAGTEGRINYPNVPIVASYFFHARSGKTSHSNMLQSLIYQITRQDGCSYSACERRYRRLREQRPDRRSAFEWKFEDLRHTFLDIVRCRISSEGLLMPTRYLFLIDALDESDDKKVEQIINLFRHELGESPHTVKTVLASRPIRNFDSSQFAAGSFHTILEGHNEGDIGRYTESEMSFLLHDTDNPDQHSRTSLFLSITKYIKENARGVFLWVVLICRALKRYTRNGYSPAGLKKELASLPKDLEGFYQMMTQRLDRNLEPRALQEARKILNWIIFAERPLTMAEMRDIIAIPFGDGMNISPSPSFLEDHRIVGWQGVKQKLRHTCGDLLEIIQHNPGSPNLDENDTVQLIHETVREFLLRDDEIAKPLHTNLYLGPQAIIEVCVRYLEVCFRSETFSPKTLMFGAEEYQQFAKALASLPLLWYIVEHLFIHLRNPVLRRSSGSSCDAILGCFKSWNHANRKHILFLLEVWMEKELQKLPGDVDISFLDSVMPDAATGFQSGCLLAAAQLNNQKLIADMFDLLGARLREKDLDVTNGLLLAAGASGDVPRVAGLLLAGAERSCRDDTGRTLLHCAAENGHEAVIEEFDLGHSSLDSSGQSPLHYAAAKGHVGAADALIRKGASPWVTDKFGCTPLHDAVRTGHEEIVRRLIESGAPKNARDNDGDTVLHYAARLGNAAIVERLLSFKVDVKIKNEKEQTAQDIAIENGHHRVTDALQASEIRKTYPAPTSTSAIFKLPNLPQNGALSRVQDTPRQLAFSPHLARRDSPVAQNEFCDGSRWKFQDEANFHSLTLPYSPANVYDSEVATTIAFATALLSSPRHPTTTARP